jgi:formamidopyrimidine-DNA glycosylase
MFDEANARLTNELCGRTIDHIYRQGKELLIQTTCGHSVVIQSDINGDIQHKRTDTKVVIPGVSVLGIANKVG